MRPNPHLVLFTGEIFNGKLHFVCLQSRPRANILQSNKYHILLQENDHNECLRWKTFRFNITILRVPCLSNFARNRSLSSFSFLLSLKERHCVESVQVSL